MTQYATLDGTSDSGGWTGSGGGAIHLDADTTTAGSDYIQGEVSFDSAPVGPAIFTLSDVTDPESASDHKIKYTALASAGGMGFGGPPDLTIALYEGTTSPNGGLRHTTTQGVSAYAITEYTITLSGGEANNISDYDNLQLQVINTGSGMGDNIKIYNMYLEVPDASAAATTGPAFLLFVD
jgi:hypothetical protein